MWDYYQLRDCFRVSRLGLSGLSRYKVQAQESSGRLGLRLVPCLAYESFRPHSTELCKHSLTRILAFVKGKCMNFIRISLIYKKDYVTLCNLYSGSCGQSDPTVGGSGRVALSGSGRL